MFNWYIDITKIHTKNISKLYNVYIKIISMKSIHYTLVILQFLFSLKKNEMT